MKTRLKATAAAILLPGSLFMLGHFSAAAVAPGAAPSTTVPPSPLAAYPPPTGDAIPTGWATHVDDTNTLALAVPTAWADTDTVPAQNDDGTPRPWISATTDSAQFFPAEGAADAFSVPGVIYLAAPYDADTQSMLTGSIYHDLCAAQPMQTFDNGFFTGHIQSYESCSGTATRVIELAAHPADRSFTAIVLVQLTGQPDDAATLNGVLRWFGRVVQAPG